VRFHLLVDTLVLVGKLRFRLLYWALQVFLVLLVACLQQAYLLRQMPPELAQRLAVTLQALFFM
jgi:hypothetical protein